MDALYRASLDKFRTEYKQFERTGEVSDALRVFKEDPQVIERGNDFPYPDNYFHLTNLSAIEEQDNTEVGEHEIEMLTDGEWLERKNSSLRH